MVQAEVCATVSGDALAAWSLGWVKLGWAGLCYNTIKTNTYRHFVIDHRSYIHTYMAFTIVHVYFPCSSSIILVCLRLHIDLL